MRPFLTKALTRATILTGAALAAFLLSASPAFSACVMPKKAVEIVRYTNPTAKVVTVFTGTDAEKVLLIYNATPPILDRLDRIDSAVVLYKRGAFNVLVLLEVNRCIRGYAMIHIAKFKAIWPNVTLTAVRI